MQLKTIYQSMSDPSIEAPDSYAAMQQAEANPNDPRFRQWVAVLLILDNEPEPPANPAT